MQFFAEGNGSLILAAILVACLVVVAVLIKKSPTYRPFFGNILVPCMFIALAILFAVITLSFPKEEAGPAALPYLWIIVLTIISVSIIFSLPKQSYAPTNIVLKVAAIPRSKALAN